jgi:N4-gp56 family major capsid protein
MATTNFGVNHPLAVSVWSKMLATEAIRDSYIGRFTGKGKDSLIVEMDDLKKGPGDNITHGLRVQLQGDGILGDATAEGNEEAMQYYDDKIVVNQLRHSVRSKGKMSEQRVPYNIRSDARMALKDWWTDRMDASFFNQICGNTAATDVRYTGNNAAIVPSTNRHIWQGGQSNDQSLTSSDLFDITLIDVARERAETASVANGTGPLIRPIMVGGEKHYVMFLHDYQVTSLRTSTSTGQWLDIQKSVGGRSKDNPIFTGALGMYNGVVLHRAARVTTGCNSSTPTTAVANTRRAVLCGAQAAGIAFGSDNGVTRFSWKEKLFDYENQLGVLAGSIFGLKKSKFIPEDDSSTNAEDFGTVVVSTYAAAATTS